ncbi:MAG: hypothetical protein HS116_24845 [Planctomycetes bacterium]|nr:hypothetical protein [Planctomycetota bacterium]
MNNLALLKIIGAFALVLCIGIYATLRMLEPSRPSDDPRGRLNSAETERTGRALSVGAAAPGTADLIASAKMLRGLIKGGLDPNDLKIKFDSWSADFERWRESPGNISKSGHVAETLARIRITGLFAIRLWILSIDIKDLPSDHDFITEIKKYSEVRAVIDPSLKSVNLRDTAMLLLGEFTRNIDLLPSGGG